MLRFEPRISDVRSARSASCATTIAQVYPNLSGFFSSGRADISDPHRPDAGDFDSSGSAFPRFRML